jgi:hypothetical protein
MASYSVKFKFLLLFVFLVYRLVHRPVYNYVVNNGALELKLFSANSSEHTVSDDKFVTILTCDAPLCYSVNQYTKLDNELNTTNLYFV